MAKMVQIHSNITIRVTTGLQNQDVTNVDAHIPDRLKVNPEWPKHQVLIRAGQGIYPAEIVEWPSVKALVADKIFTIGAISEVANSTLTAEQQKDVLAASEAKEEFKLGVTESTESTESTKIATNLNVSKKKTLTLNDLAGGN